MKRNLSGIARRIPFARPSLVGVDIQPHGIRLVQLSKSKAGFQLEKTAQCALPYDMFDDGKITRWQALTSILSQLVFENGLLGAPAAIAIPESMTRRQRIHLPVGSACEVAEPEVNAYLRRDLPGMADALSVDFAALRLAGKHALEVSVIAARQTYVAMYEECVRLAGLAVRMVDIDSYAIMRALCADLPEVNAVVHWLAGEAVFIGFDGQDMVMLQRFEAATYESVHSVCQNMQTLLAAQRDFKLLGVVVCAPALWQSAFVDTWQASPVYQMPATLHLGMKEACSEEFVIAAGLAMREVPAW